MNGSRVVLRALAWKESKQLLPLVLTLIVLQFVLGCVLAWSDMQTGGVNPIDIVSMGMPLAYAIGVGGFLIGQEKDCRSIYWLRSLPIANSEIVWSKSIAATAGLVVIWITSLLMALVWRQWTGSDYRSNSDNEFVAFIPYVILSIGVVWAGLGFAWRMRSALHGFLWLLPTIAGIFLVVFLSFDLFFSSTDETAWYLWQSSCFGIILPFALIMVFLEGFRFTRSPETTQPSPYEKSFPNAKPAETIVDASDSATRKPPQELWVALTRQSWMQNRLSYTILTLLIVVGAPIALALLVRDDGKRTALAFVCLLGVTPLIAWMGAIPFLSERIQNRVRFLADRGASPAEVWLSRMVIPVTILLSVGFAIWLISLKLMSLEPIAPRLHQQLVWGKENRFLFAFVLWLIVNYCVLATLGAGVWAGQLVRSPVIAMIIAPIFTWLMLGYNILVFTQAETPFWVLPVFLLAPFLCTFQATKLWLDDSSPFRFYRIHSVYLAAVLVIPWLPGLVRLASIPTPPADTIAEWNQIAKESSRNTSRSNANRSIDYLSNITVKGNGRSTSDNFQIMFDSAHTVPIYLRDRLIEDTKKRLLRDESTPPYSQSDFEWFQGMFYPNLAYFRYMASAKTTSESSDPEKQVAMYRTVISQLIEDIQNARLYQPASAFCRTDQWECLLLNEVLHPETASLLDPPTYRQAIQLLKDDAARRTSRQRAVACTYQICEKSPTRQSFFSQFNEYPNIELFRETSIMRHFAGRRLTRYAIYALWMSANAKTNEEIAKSNTMMDYVWGEDLFYKESFTAAPISLTPPVYIWTGRPGGLWNKRWETIARELVVPE